MIAFDTEALFHTATEDDARALNAAVDCARTDMTFSESRIEDWFEANGLDAECVHACLGRLRANGLIRPADGRGWYLLTAEGVNRYYDCIGEAD